MFPVGILGEVECCEGYGVGEQVLGWFPSCVQVNQPLVAAAPQGIEVDQQGDGQGVHSGVQGEEQYQARAPNNKPTSEQMI